MSCPLLGLKEGYCNDSPTRDSGIERDFFTKGEDASVPPKKMKTWEAGSKRLRVGRIGTSHRHVGSMSRDRWMTL